MTRDGFVRVDAGAFFERTATATARFDAGEPDGELLVLYLRDERVVATAHYNKRARPVYRVRPETRH